MPSTIDNRIVEMQFDNQQFERNISKSILSLDRLKQGLNLDGATKGIERIEQTLKGFTLDPVVNTLDSLNSKFDAVSNAGVRALNRIKDQAIDTGIQLVKSLTIGQANAGFGKYESKTQAVATMQYAIEGGMTEEGTERIYKQLERLQWYADETSYSFSAMTDGMSKFVAAGASLEEAEQSMEGIANWAATAGVGAQSYKFLNVVQQLSQAAGSGVVMGQDWSSIETATMATRGFKQAVIDAAKEEKTLVEIDGKLYAAGVKLTKSNKEQHEVTVDNLSKTLRDKWLTFGVLKKILDSYAKDPAAFQAAQVARTMTDAVESAKDAVSSGWAKTYELIFGDVNQSAKFFTDLANALIAATDEVTSFRNEILQTWNDNGGRDAFIRAFWNIWTILGGITRSFEEAFGLTAEGLTESLGNKLVDLTTRFEHATEAVLGLFESIELLTGGEAEEKTETTINKVTGDLSNLQKYAKESETAVRGMINTGSVKMKEGTVQTFTELADAYKELDEYISSGEVTAEGLEERFTKIEQLNEKASKTNKLLSTKKKSLDAMKEELSGYKDASKETVEVTKVTDEELTEEEKEIVYRNQRLVEVFSGLKDFFGIFKDAMNETKNGFIDFAKKFKPLIIPVLNLVSSLAAYVSNVRKVLRINKTFQKQVTRIKDAFSPLTDRIGEVGEKLNEFAKIIHDKDTNTFFNGPIGEKFQKVFSGVGSAIDIANRALSHMIYFGSTVMSKFIAPVAGKIGTWFLDKFAAIGDWIRRVDAALKDNNMFQKIRDDIDLLGQWLDENLDPYLQKIESFITPIVSTIEQFFGDTGESFIAGINVNTDDASSLKEKIELRIQAFENAFTNSETGKKVQALKDKINGFFEPIFKALEPITKPIGQLLSDLWSSAAASLKSSGAKPERFYENLDEYVDPSLSDEIAARLDAFAKAFEGSATGKKVQEVVDKINAFFEPIFKALEPITKPVGQLMHDLWTSVAAAVNSSGAESESATFTEELTARLDAFAEAFSNTETAKKVSEISSNIQNFFQPIVSALEFVKENMATPIEGIKGAFTGIVEWVSDIFEKLFGNGENKSLDKAKDSSADISALDILIESTIKPVAERVFKGISWVIDKMMHLLDKYSVSDITKNGLKFAAVAGAITTVVTSIVDAWQALKVLEDLQELIEKLIDRLGGESWDYWTRKLLGISASIMFVGFGMEAIADAITKLSELNLGELLLGTGGVAGIAGILSQFIKTIANVNTGKKITGKGGKNITENIFGGFGISVAAKFIGIATAFQMLANSVKTLSSLNLEGLLIGEGGLAGIAAILATFMKELAGVNGREKVFGKGGRDITETIFGGFGISVATKFIGIATAFGMLADAVKSLSSLNLEELLIGEGGLAGIAAILYAFMQKVSGVTTNKTLKGKGMKEITESFLGGFGLDVAGKFKAIAKSFQMLADAVKSLSSLNLEELLIGEGGLAGIAAILYAFMQKVSGVTTNKTLKGKGMKEIVSSLLGGFGIDVATKFIGVAKSFKMLADAVKSLSSLNLEELLIGEGGLAGIAAILYAFMQKVSGVTTGTTLKGKGMKEVTDSLMSGLGIGVATKFISIAKSFQMLADAVTSLSKLNLEEILIGEGGLGGIAFIFSEFIKKFSTIKMEGSVIDKLTGNVGIIAIAWAFDKLAGALKTMGSQDFASLLKGMLGSGGVIVLMEQLVAGMSKIQLGGVTEKLTGSAGIIALAWVFDKLSSSIERLGSMEFANLVQGMMGSGGTIALLAATARMLGNVSVGSALQAAGDLALLVGSLGAVMAAIGALTAEFPQIDEWIDKGGDTMRRIGRAVGSLIGGFIEGLMPTGTADEKMEEFKELAHQLVSFGDESAKINFDETERAVSVMERIGDIAGSMSTMAVTGEGITTLEKFIRDFEGLAGSITTFSSSFENFNIDKAESATSIIERLIGLAKTMNETVFDDGGTANGWEGAIAYMTQIIDSLTMNEQFGRGIGNFAANILNGLTESLSTNTAGILDSMLNSDSETQFTIRPVLDLTDVQNGLAGLDGSLFGNVDLSASLAEAINSESLGIDQVVSELQTINTSVSSLHESNASHMGAVENILRSIHSMEGVINSSIGNIRVTIDYGSIDAGLGNL